MIFRDIKARQLGHIITAKQFRGAPKLGYSWYQKAKASDQLFTSSPSLAPLQLELEPQLLVLQVPSGPKQK
jgi:hypothetical protein